MFKVALDMIVKAKHIFTMEGEGVGYIENMAMVIDRGRIADFVPVDNVDERLEVDKGLQTGDDSRAGDGKGGVQLQ